MGLPVFRQLVDMVVERRGDADIHLDGTGLAVAVRGVGTAADAARLATDAAAAERAAHRAAAPHRRLSSGGRGRYSVGAGAIEDGDE